MAYQLGLTDASLYADHIKPGRELRGRSRARPRRRALGGAERLLALDDRCRDRRARGGGRARPRERRCGVRRRLAGCRRRHGSARSRAGPSRPTARSSADPYFIRLSKTGDPNAADQLWRRQRRPDARPARRHRCRLPRARPSRRAARERSRRSCASLPIVDDDDQVDHPERARLAPLQRRRLWRPGAATAGRGHRAGRGPATSGRCCRPSAPSTPSRRATRDCATSLLPGMRRVRVRRRAHPRAGLGAAGPRRVPYGTDPTIASIGFKAAGRRVRVTADLVGCLVRPARRGPRRRSATSRCRPPRMPATSRTRQATTHAHRHQPGSTRPP